MKRIFFQKMPSKRKYVLRPIFLKLPLRALSSFRLLALPNSHIKLMNRKRIKFIIRKVLSRIFQMLLVSRSQISHEEKHVVNGIISRMVLQELQSSILSKNFNLLVCVSSNKFSIILLLKSFLRLCLLENAKLLNLFIIYNYFILFLLNLHIFKLIQLFKLYTNIFKLIQFEYC